jgi:hypothetical protein
MANAKNIATRGRGRPAEVETSKQKAALLQRIGTDNAPSRYITMQLADAGLVAFETVQSGKRGRPQQNAVVSGKGRSLLALAARWK